MRDPSAGVRLTSEDFGSGTAAAARGGLTTVVDMPNTWGPPIDGPTLAAKVEAVQPKALTDFGLTGLLHADTSEADISSLVGGGAFGLNVFNGVEVHGQAAPDDGKLWEIVGLASGHGLPIGMLCENLGLVQAARESMGGKDRVTNWLEARTEAAEVEAIASYLALSWSTGSHVHINHLSTGRGLDLIRRAQCQGATVTCETSPHQLLVTR